VSPSCLQYSFQAMAETRDRSRSPARRHGKFEIFQSDKNQEFYFRLKAGNGEIILASEGYKKKDGAEHGIKSVQENSVKPEHFEKRESKNGHPYFVLKAANHQIIGTSEMYEGGVAGRDNGIDSVARNAPTAKIVDLVEAKHKTGKFEMFKSEKNGEFYFRLKATNGQIILQSEGYKQKAGCENGIRSVRENSTKPEMFENRDSVNGDPYFVLKAGNGEIIGKSEMYEGGAAGRDNGIASVTKNASEAELEDLTLN